MSGVIPRPLCLRDATENDAARLTEIAVRAKASWGYDEAFMLACHDELRVDHSTIERHHVVLAERGAEIVGFYALGAREGDEIELEAMFVEPKAFGRGVGRALMAHASDAARAAGAKTLTIQSEPNATGFYLAHGARHIGERPSDSIPGRSLPLLEIELSA